jgi:hypothetical protein
MDAFVSAPLAQSGSSMIYVWRGAFAGKLDGVAVRTNRDVCRTLIQAGLLCRQATTHAHALSAAPTLDQ